MILLLLACRPDATKPSDTDSAAETATITETADTGGGEQPREARLSWEGAATVDGAYLGEEPIELVGDLGLGDPLCLIHYTVLSTAALTDCAACEWAYAVTLGEPELLLDEGCALAGYDAASIAAIDGQTRSCGLARNYLGHADALLVLSGDTWTPVSFVSWDDASMTLRYSWDQGYVEY